MSYTRFFESDAYLVGSHDQDGIKVVECVMCRLVEAPVARAAPSASPVFATYSDLLHHIAAHRAVGHRIPRHVDERIWKEIDSADPSWLAVGESLPERPSARPIDDPVAREHVAELVTNARQALAALVDDVDARAALRDSPGRPSPTLVGPGGEEPPTRLDLLEVFLTEMDLTGALLVLPPIYPRA